MMAIFMALVPTYEYTSYIYIYIIYICIEYIDIHNNCANENRTSTRGGGESVETIKLHVTLSAVQYALRKPEVLYNRCVYFYLFSHERRGSVY